MLSPEVSVLSINDMIISLQRGRTITTSHSRPARLVVGSWKSSRGDSALSWSIKEEGDIESDVAGYAPLTTLPIWTDKQLGKEVFSPSLQLTVFTISLIDSLIKKQISTQSTPYNSNPQDFIPYLVRDLTPRKCFIHFSSPVDFFS
jgi:hypothetical protein